MIEPLRRLHRRAVFTLAAVLPAIFAAGLATRHAPTPVNASLTEGSARREWRAPASLRLGKYEASARRSAAGDWLRIEPAAELLEPDLLVYWSGSLPSGTALPPDARLLGALAAARDEGVRLPGSSGAVIVYSLPHQELIGGIRLGDLP